MTPIKVMLVEDSAGDARLIREYLAESGAQRFEVAHLTHLAPALEEVARQPPDVVLLDPGLPDSQGLDTVRRLLAAAPNTPVVVVSGLGDQQTALRAVQEGAQDYLVKGQVAPNELARALRYAIERFKAQSLLHQERARSEVLEANQTRLREINEAQRRFLADAAHELRAPLTSIQGNLELLQRFPHMSADDRRSALTDAAHEARRLTRLVGDMLSLARSDAAGPIRQDSVPLDRVLIQAWAEAGHLVNGHRLESELAQAVWVRGDADYLRQLALILLDNAVRYTPPPGLIRLELQTFDGQAIFRVRDSGVGIAAEDLPRVFERFYRADKARNHDGNLGGGGLGLPIAQWIAHAHHGRISLESRPELGTTVSVYLPLAQPGDA